MRRSVRRIGMALSGAVVLLLDVLVAALLVSLGADGLWEIGGLGVGFVAVVLTALAAVNLLLTIGLLYPRAVRQAELSSERPS